MTDDSVTVLTVLYFMVPGAIIFAFLWLWIVGTIGNFWGKKQ